MHRSSQWFVAQAISSVQHGVGSRLAFELARRAKGWIAPRRGATDSPIQGFAVTVRSEPCLAIEDALGLKAKGVELLEIPLSPSRLFELTKGKG